MSNNMSNTSNTINIGFGNIALANRIVAVVSPESAPIKRLIQETREKGKLIDATYGRKTRAVIITDCDYIILSAVQPDTMAQRFDNHNNK
jgi:regulator of extracellular matrix RemA (YlzA/DUF370 family)